ncbi:MULTISPECIES: TetR/AcrR family transcriptional regulator [unclassified Streptomyces]|uniref:TetR/AcrR family transcriptional regulator n=1 Tax=unclassified Streptomyces TaxID=2593676 RepID=UPI001BEBA068|nr:MULTISPECIES: TetR/AcrR family transcriptional regulator [unclassified Streptomyces]MBT2408330.1 TetR/AcrR family transcriptional regulator [Streptomyces sp. ISL-21]MBT2457911.1 TetR/AcrR family transcriptional regulator [Streptomyces sp. ISL-86]MBT2611731.1 TetR/AcrR family transcriptional regulator [Streptomyces sp. ISL-87]
MGNREDLLAGARRCLEEKGYLRTTVRDIASASQVSMAAIGYHFGSRDALLNQALFAAMDEWSAGSGRLAGRGDTVEERYADTWDRKIQDFGDMRWLWIASVEAFVHAQSSPELLATLAAGQRQSRRMVAAALRGVSEEAVAEDDVRALGSVHLALLTGVMVQALTDPEQAPDGREIAQGLRRMAELLER